MIHRSGFLTKIEHCGKYAGYVILSSLYGGFKVISFCSTRNKNSSVYPLLPVIKYNLVSKFFKALFPILIKFIISLFESVDKVSSTATIKLPLPLGVSASCPLMARTTHAIATASIFLLTLKYVTHKAPSIHPVPVTHLSVAPIVSDVQNGFPICYDPFIVYYLL